SALSSASCSSTKPAGLPGRPFSCFRNWPTPRVASWRPSLSLIVSRPRDRAVLAHSHMMSLPGFREPGHGCDVACRIYPFPSSPLPREDLRSWRSARRSIGDRGESGRFPSRRPTMGKKLYVGNLTYGVTDATLEQMFAAHGGVRSAQVIMDRDTGRCTGLGFVAMY